MQDETAGLLEAEAQLISRPERRVNSYLALLTTLFSFPLAASQIVVYDLLYDVVCGELKIPGERCSVDPQATKVVADLLSAISLLSGLTATIVMASISVASDRLGRKFGLLWFMVLTTFGIITYPVVAYFVPAETTHWRILFPCFLTALGGTPSLMLNMSVLFITDLLPDPVTRTKFLSRFLGVTMYVQALAPGTGSALLKSSGMQTSAYMLLCGCWMAVGTLIFAASFKGSEIKSRPPHDVSALDTSETSVVQKTLTNAVNIITFQHCETPERKANAWILLLNFFMSNEFAVGFLDLVMVYAKHHFNWEAPRVGQTLFYLFTIRTLWALVGFPFLYGRLTLRWPAKNEDVDRSDLTIMTASSILTFLGYGILGLAKTSAQYTTGTVVLANDGLAGPIWINTLLKHVSEYDKGKFMAAISLVNKPVGALLPPLLMMTFKFSRSMLFAICVMAWILTLSLMWLRPSR